MGHTTYPSRCVLSATAYEWSTRSARASADCAESSTTLGPKVYCLSVGIRIDDQMSYSYFRPVMEIIRTIATVLTQLQRCRSKL